MVSAKAAEQVETRERRTGVPAEENGHPGGATAMEQAARDHVWIHQLPWAEFESDNLRIFDRGEGARLYDVHGREYLDGIAGLWVVNAGHGRREIAQAYADQAARLGYASAMTYTTTPAVKLAEKLAELTPGDLNRLFFGSGGSEAVETAIKIAKQVQAMRGFPKRYKIIARRGSYHGMTYGAMSLTATRNETWFGPFMYGVYHVPHPNRYRSDFGLEGEEADIMAARYVEQEIVNQGPETVAAVIGEPISTAAGVHVPSPKYWQMLREICDRHGVLLIADEVINGFGRTGTMFATEQFGVRARHHDDGEGPLLRLRADRRRHRPRVGLRRLQGEQGSGHGPPADLRWPPRRLRRGAEEPRDLRARESGRAGRREGRVSQVPARGAARPSDRRRRARARA